MALCNGSSVTHVHGGDRFSSLKDDLVHHIFSFLGYNDMARIRLVSKRFNQLGIISPYLFLKPYSRYREQYNMKGGNFRTFLRMLIVRRRRIASAPPIRAIRIHWFSMEKYSDYHRILYSLIKHASEGQVLQELNMTIILDLPPQTLQAWWTLIRECRSLEILRLNCLYANNNSFVSCLAANNNAMSLRTLSLESISMSFFSGYNIDINSSTLRVLELVDVYTSLQCKLCITCPSLEILRMEDVRFSHNSALEILCPSLTELIMNGCHFFNKASILIIAHSLVRLRYESRRDTRSLFERESFTIYTPKLQHVIIVPPRSLIQSDSVMPLGLIKHLQVLLTFCIKVRHYDPLGSLLSTPTLKYLSIRTREWICHISDAELFRVFRSCPASMEAEERKFLLFLQQRANKSIRFYIVNK